MPWKGSDIVIDSADSACQTHRRAGDEKVYQTNRQPGQAYAARLTLPGVIRKLPRVPEHRRSPLRRRQTESCIMTVNLRNQRA
jgi:hypothetical protein